MVQAHPRTILGKIAAAVHAAIDERARSGSPAATRSARLADGSGWSAADVVCSAGPRDAVFEEQHAAVSVAVVVAGSFQYRTPRGTHLMTPGTLFLGNVGECYECGHEHAAGDRCVAFSFSPDYMDKLSAELGVRRATFTSSRVPPKRESAGVVAAVATALAGGPELSWEETAIDVAAAALTNSQSNARATSKLAEPSRHTLARVTEAVRAIERDPAGALSLTSLADAAELSAFQFLRAFRRVTGTTPHQYVLRARLREAAALLRTTQRTVLEIGLDAGFNDLSNFNHAFRAEFGVAPRSYRAARVG